MRLHFLGRWMEGLSYSVALNLAGAAGLQHYFTIHRIISCIESRIVIKNIESTKQILKE